MRTFKQRPHVAAAGLLLAVFASRCGSSSTSITGPSPEKCSVLLSIASSSLASSGGPGTVNVSTGRECTWSASSEVSWVTLTSQSEGRGSGTVNFSAAANPLSISRRGGIVVNGQRAELVQQAGCGFGLSSSVETLSSTGGTITVSVSAASGCLWTADRHQAWVAIVSGAEGNGNGSVTISVAPNLGGARTATLTIAGLTLTLHQRAAGASCASAIAPAGASIAPDGGSGTITVTAPGTCGWTASSDVPWMTITSGAAGTGNEAVMYSVAANGGTSRTGTLDVAGRIFTVTQAGMAVSCSYAITPASQSAGIGGGPGSVTVSAPAGCTWAATSNVPWITFTSGAGGSGNGTISFAIAANPGGARTGTLIVADQTFVVHQAGCTYSIGSTSQSVAQPGGNGTVAVTATSGCTWTSVSHQPLWLSITAGGTGTGNGTVAFTVATNSGTARTGTLIVAGQSFTVNQAGCPYSITPTSQSIPQTGFGGAVAVTTVTGCAWTATSTVPWIATVGGDSGIGSGTVIFVVAPNSGLARTGTLIIGGQTFTVTQAGCTYGIGPTSASVPRTAGSGFLTVITSGGCGWTATSDSPWMTVAGGASGAGTGPVSYTVAANAGAARTGRITIGPAGLKFTIEQAAGR